MKSGFVDIQDVNIVRMELSPVYAVSLQETEMSVLDSLVLSAIFFAGNIYGWQRFKESIYGP